MVGSPLELRIVLGIELLGRRVDVGRVDVVVDRVERRLRRGERDLGRDLDLFLDLLPDQLELRLGRDALLQQPAREGRERIARGIGLALRGGAVVHLVVGQRMRVRADHLGVHQRRPLALTAVVVRLLHRLVGGERVAAIDFLDEEARERRDQLADRATCGVHLDRDRDRVAVVFDQEDHRQLQVAGGVQRLPELALAGGAVTGGDEDHLVALVSARPSRSSAGGAQPGLGRADGLQELRPGRRRGR